MAALAGVESAVHLQIRMGADVNAKDAKGRSPLVLAASGGHTETCRILLDAGADPLMIDGEGNDALASFCRETLVALVGQGVPML
jgi:RNA polymerase primary sigma factor